MSCRKDTKMPALIPQDPNRTDRGGEGIQTTPLVVLYTCSFCSKETATVPTVSITLNSVLVDLLAIFTK